MHRLAGFPPHLPRKLALCRSPAQQLEWVRAALGLGKTVTDVGLWLGGVDEPKELIRCLIREGGRVITFRKKLTDAAGEACTVMAWRLQEG